MKIERARTPEGVEKQKELLHTSKKLFKVGTALAVTTTTLSIFAGIAAAASIFYPPLLIVTVSLLAVAVVTGAAALACIIAGYILLQKAKELGENKNFSSIISGISDGLKKAGETARAAQEQQSQPA